MSTLKELLQQSSDLEAQILSSYGEVTDEQMDALANIELKTTEKVDKYCGLLDKLEHDAEYFKKKAEKFTTAASQISRLKEKLLQNVRQQMIQRELEILEGIDEKFKLQSSTGKLVVKTTDSIPKDFFVQTVSQELDRSKLKSSILAGEKYDGVWIEPTIKRVVNKGK